MKIDNRCTICPLGIQECLKRIEEKMGRKPRKLRPGHPWTIEWCPYLRGFRPSQLQEKKVEEKVVSTTTS